jgi:hypothetical protein
MRMRHSESGRTSVLELATTEVVPSKKNHKTGAQHYVLLCRTWACTGLLTRYARLQPVKPGVAMTSNVKSDQQIF